MNSIIRSQIFSLCIVVLVNALAIDDVFGGNGHCITKNVVVVVMDPSSNSANSVVTRINGRIQKTGLDILNALASACGDHVAILAHEDLRVEVLTQMISMATKVGFAKDNVSTFVFYKNHERMMDLRYLRNVPYSEAPNVIEDLIR